MKKVIIFLVIGIILIPSLVLADGMVIPNYEGKVYLPSQKAVIVWNEGEETLLLSTKISPESVANLAWIIPIPSETKPEIEAGDIDIFYDLANLFLEDKKGPGCAGPMAGPGEKVEVIEFKKVDIYDITTLKATDASALVDWLNENGYITPETAVPVLEEYCQQANFYFIANKINLANKYQDMTEQDQECAELIKEMVELERYRDKDYLRGQYESAFDQIYECQEADFEVVVSLLELAQGVATPIMIKFRPDGAFYPLRISSVNEGETVVDVYLFGETPAKDKSNILSVSGMTKNTSLFEEKYNLDQEYVTYLSYSGDLKDLTADAWFEPKVYDSSLDPKYVSLGDRFFSIFITVLAILIYLGIVGLIVFGLIVLFKKIITRLIKK